jgi:hypothetical protein
MEFMTMPFAVFILRRDKNRQLDNPCLDPLSYGRESEPEPTRLLRRGRVQVFATTEAAEQALRDSMAGHEKEQFARNFKFQILEVEL